MRLFGKGGFLEAPVAPNVPSPTPSPKPTTLSIVMHKESRPSEIDYTDHERLNVLRVMCALADNHGEDSIKLDVIRNNVLDGWKR